MITARWEILPNIEAFALPQGGILTRPALSGTINRADYGPAPDFIPNTDASLFNPSNAIVVPGMPDGSTFWLLRVEVIGSADWLLTIAPYGETPQASDGQRPEHDPVPAILIPSPGIAANGGRCLDVRAVRPGSSFILQPLRPNL